MAEDIKIQLHVWSDYVCPFCYLELPELERLRSETGSHLQIEWRAFELRPEPQPTLDPDGEYLHRAWNSSVYPMAAERGLDLKLPPVQPRSRKALGGRRVRPEPGAVRGYAPGVFPGRTRHRRRADPGRDRRRCGTGPGSSGPRPSRRALHGQGPGRPTLGAAARHQWRARHPDGLGRARIGGQRRATL